MHSIKISYVIKIIVLFGSRVKSMFSSLFLIFECMLQLLKYLSDCTIKESSDGFEDMSPLEIDNKFFRKTSYKKRTILV